MASNSKNIAELLNGTAFASTGIDDNADATAITIDSSENVLVGTTNADVSFSTTSGSALQPSGQTHHSAAGTAIVLNRTASDGTIAQFRQGGGTIGSIGTASGDLHIDGTTNHSGIRFQEDSLIPRKNGANTNGQIDLGYNDGSTILGFKDLTLSGGVYLGGTGSANKLHDYEEGEYIPTLTGATSGSATLRSGYNYLAYTKVGRLVTVTGRWETTGGHNMVGNVKFSLPFAQSGSLSAQAECGVGTISMNRTGTNFDSTNLFQTVTFPTEAQFYIYYQPSGTGNEAIMQGSQLDAAFEGFVNHTYLTD